MKKTGNLSFKSKFTINCTDVLNTNKIKQLIHKNKINWKYIIQQLIKYEKTFYSSITNGSY